MGNIKVRIQFNIFFLLCFSQTLPTISKFYNYHHCETDLNFVVRPLNTKIEKLDFKKKKLKYKQYHNIELVTIWRITSMQRSIIHLKWKFHFQCRYSRNRNRKIEKKYIILKIYCLNINIIFFLNLENPGWCHYHFCLSQNNDAKIWEPMVEGSWEALVIKTTNHW